MKNNDITYLHKNLVVIVLFCLLCGCASTSGYKKPISDFQNASSVVTQCARVYITQLNKTQRDAYVDRQVSKSAPIKLMEINEMQVFSPEGLAVRLKALETLTKYGDLLMQLVEADTPGKISSNASDLSDVLNRLEKNIGAGNIGQNPGVFQSAFGPASLLIGEVARLAVEQKIQTALDQAIIEGEEPVKKLIRAVRDDLVMAYELKRNVISNSRVIYIDGYETDRMKGNNQVVLRKRGEEIKSILDVWETLPTSNPSEGLDAMADAHTALVDYARSPRDAKDLAAFAAQMETFVARAMRVGKAVKQLQ